jgi:hypothetical protein
VGQANCILVTIDHGDEKSAIFFDTGIQNEKWFNNQSFVKKHIEGILNEQNQGKVVRDVIFILSHMDNDHINIFHRILEMCLKKEKTIAGIWVSYWRRIFKSVIKQELELDENFPDKQLSCLINGNGDSSSIDLIKNVAKIDFLMPRKNSMQYGYYIIQNLNDASLVTKLTYGKKSILFTGDAPGKLFNSIVANLGQNFKSLIPDILICPHHGSMSENSYRWRGELNHLNMISIISSSPNGRDKLPERSFMDYTPKHGLKYAPHIIAYRSKLSDAYSYRLTSAPLFVTACSGIPLRTNPSTNEGQTAIKEYMANGVGYHVKIAAENSENPGTISIKAMFVNGNDLDEKDIEIIKNAQVVNGEGEEGNLPMDQSPKKPTGGN